MTRLESSATPVTTAPSPPWQPLRTVHELRIRTQCPYCGRRSSWSQHHLRPNGRGAVRVELVCSCGAVFWGSLAGDWYSPDTRPQPDASPDKANTGGEGTDA